MLLEILDIRRDEMNDDVVQRLGDYHALYAGGDEFEDRRIRLLPKRPFETAEMYTHRLDSAHYVNYSGPIVDFFISWLFTGRLDIRERSGDELPDFYEQFKEDCDRSGTDLTDFMKERMTTALVKKRAWVLVDFPRVDGYVPVSRADFEAKGLDRAYLCPIPTESVLDWEFDGAGELSWVIIHDIENKRTSPSDNRDFITETWTIWEREGWSRYALTYDKTKGRPPPKTTIVPKVAEGPGAAHGKVPLVAVEVPVGLWILNRIFSPQREHLRMRNALSWSLARTCYAMRILKSLDKEQPPVHGAGYGMVIGIEEDVKWDAPPADAFAPLAGYLMELKEELYRITHQMALSVDNNAAAVGRSGESKVADNAVTETVLKAYGACVRASLERIYDLISRGREESYTWHISGLDSYSTNDTKSLIENAVTAATLGIQSVTFKKMVDTKVALAMLPDISQEDQDAIAEEIRAASAEPSLDLSVDSASGAIQADAGEAQASKVSVSQNPMRGPYAKGDNTSSISPVMKVANG